MSRRLLTASGVLWRNILSAEKGLSRLLSSSVYMLLSSSSRVLSSSKLYLQQASLLPSRESARVLFLLSLYLNDELMDIRDNQIFHLAAMILSSTRAPFSGHPDFAVSSSKVSPTLTVYHLRSSFILALVTGHSASRSSLSVSGEPDLAA